MATERIRYVDTGSSGGNGTTAELTGANAAYASLAAMEAAEDDTGDLVTRDEWLHVYCAATGGAADTTNLVLIGFTTDATRYILIEAAAGHRAGLSWNTGKYRLSISNATAMDINEDFVRVDGLQIEQVAVNANNQHAITIATQTTGVNARTWLSNLLIKGPASGTYYQRGINSSDADATVYCWNVHAYNYGTVSGTYVVYCGDGSMSFYSGSSIGGQYAFRSDTTSGGLTCKNAYGGGSGTEDFYCSASATLTKVNCASEDQSADDSGSPAGETATNCVAAAVLIDTDTFVNVTGGSEDFHLAADGLSPLDGVGVDTSGESAPLNFTTDIDGDTIVNWSIGADDGLAADTDVTLPLTGVSGTASVGTLALSAALALAGLAGTAAVGTLGPDVTVPISGVEAPASVGTMSPMQAAVLAGIEAVDAAGDMGQSVEIPVSGNSTGMTYPISGTEAIGEVGAVMAEIGVGPDITIPLTGVSANPAYQLSGVAAVGEVGTVSPVEGGDIILPLTGVFGTGAVGDVVYLELGGWAATGEIGNVTPNVSLPITGNEATTAVGDAVPDRTVGLNGVAAIGVPGGWGVISRPLTGMDGISDVGTLTPLISGAITGNAATTAKGSVTQEHTVALVGIAGTGVAGYMDSLMEGDVVRPLTGVYATGRAGTVTCGTASPNYIHVKPRKRILTVTPRHRIITVSRRRF